MDAAPPPADDTALDDLRRRLRATRFLDGVPGGWDRGTDAAYLADLVYAWADDYDWRAAEERIRALPWELTSDGMRAIHQRAEDPHAPAVVLLHGWPDSVLRYERVLPLLTDVHVVVPALPGFPYSDLPPMSGAAMADPIAVMLGEMGHDRFLVSGGDVGASVAESLARRFPDRVLALHLTDIGLGHLATVPAEERTPAEQLFAVDVERWRAREGGYNAEQATKPNTLTPALGDSPVGLASWLVEKLRGWSDCGGDVEQAFPRDELLTWITLYWVTGTIGTSFGPYALREPPVPGRLPVPTVVSVFANDVLPAPRELAERVLDVRVWDEQPAGGHFAAWEQPEAFVAGLRKAIDLVTGAPSTGAVPQEAPDPSPLASAE
jgi:pimeloyl-ACP methyl ester carboxylesterase